MTTPTGTTGPAPTHHLGRRAARGGMVMMGGQALRMSIQLVTVAVLSRLLSPRDFGLLAMVMAVVAVAEIFRDMGLSTAAIQAKDLTRAERDNLLWLNTGIGLLLAVATFAAAPLVSRLFDEPVLAPMTRAMAVMFVLNGLATQYRADLTRRMLFGRLVLADTSAPLVGLGAAVTLAWGGAGHWALVGQQLSQYATLLLVAALAAGWLPGRPRRRVPMTGFLRFGWTLTATQVLHYVSNNAAVLLLGTRLGAGPLGLYNRAYQVLMYPLTTLRGAIGTVALSALAKVQDDREMRQRYVEQGQLTIGCTVIAGLGLVVGAAGPISDVLLGGTWDVGAILAWLAVAGALQALAVVGYWVYVSQHLGAALLRYSVISESIKVGCLVLGSAWGPVGVAAANAVAQAVSWPLSLWWLARHSDVRVAPLYAGALRIVLLTAATALGARAGVVLAAQAPSAVALVAATASAAAAYGAVVLLVPPVRRDVIGVLAMSRAAVRR